MRRWPHCFVLAAAAKVAAQDCTLKELLDVTTATDKAAVVTGLFSSHPECGLCLVGCAALQGDEASACGIGCASPPKPPDPPTRAPAAPAYVMAQTEYGPVRGQEIDDVLVYLGVPFAAAPTGNLRWRPPVPPEKWTEPVNADSTFVCLWWNDDDGDSGGSDETCLQANVFAPKGATAIKSVMVYIHGGNHNNQNPPKSP